MSHLVIGTRGSALALWQSEYVRAALLAEHPDLEISLEVIRTKGDKILDSALSKIGDKGLFTKEIEKALLEGNVDLAVHKPSCCIGGAIWLLRPFVATCRPGSRNLTPPTPRLLSSLKLDCCA